MKPALVRWGAVLALVVAGCGTQNQGEVTLPDACGRAAGAVASVSANGSLAAFGLADDSSSIGRVYVTRDEINDPTGRLPRGRWYCFVPEVGQPRLAPLPRGWTPLPP